ncbi:MAG: transcription termination factor NusA [Candidatus Ancillula sp.]|nr:transcription termination factor NusA [Candidatus Ancillula sp.]
MDVNIGALKGLMEEHGIDLKSATEAVEEAVLAAYHKTPDSYEHARAELNIKTGHITIWARKPLENARAVDEELALSDEFEDNPKEFGHIAASAARQTILAKLRQAEDFQVLGEFKDKKGQLISGVVKPFEEKEARWGSEIKGDRSQKNGLIKLDVGEGVEVQLPKHEQVPGEEYTPSSRFRVYVESVSRGPKGPQIIVSRTEKNLVRKLFELEVPEIASGQVRIESIAREAGYRTKIAIRSLVEGVNAKGAFIGSMGARVRSVMDELNGEKIDIIDWDEQPAKYIANALSPSKTVGVKVLDEQAKLAHVVVPDGQLSLAIGRDGQNARLAAKLTGWKIDISSDKVEAAKEAK